MASSSSAPSSASSPILEECKRLQAVESLMTKLWHDEVHHYEHSSPSNSNNGDANNNCETRNHPNHLGTITNPTLFPYHTALYPLLDCYDSIRDDVQHYFEENVRPSPSVMPFHPNCHRRSKFSERMDRHGIQIEELAMLNGHLPNSAWAVKMLMPRERGVEFGEFESLQRMVLSVGSGSGEIDDNQTGQGENIQEEDEEENIQDEASRHNHNRFWNILMNPISESAPVHLSEMSVPPDDNDDEWEDDSEEEDDTNHWQDAVDHEEEEEQSVESATVDDPAIMTRNAQNARDFTFLKWWQHAIVTERRGQIHHGKSAKIRQPPSVQEYSPESLFATTNGTPSSSATFVLLRVLKHSLSDLQREFRLARAVVLLIADWHLCDEDDGEEDARKEGSDELEGGGIECLRRLLTIVSSEYVPSCGGYCHEWYMTNHGINQEDEAEEYEDILDSGVLDTGEPTHYCSDWWEFLGSVSTLISYGITYMTHEHANVICAFVYQEINRTSTSAGANGGGNSSETISGKDYLKQNIYFLNNAEYDTQRGRTTEGGAPQDAGSGPQLNVNLLLTILSALRQHAVSDKLCLARLMDVRDGSETPGGGKEQDDEDQISKRLGSFQACVDIIVDIGERILLRLPNNSQGRQLGGMVVRSLVESYCDSENFSLGADKSLSYLARETDSTNLRSAIDPLRYADAVAKASENPLLDPNIIRGNNNKPGGKHSMKQLIGVQPPRDVQDIVKALFMRDLVDLQVSGCGYGDFLLWCHLPISPEPLLFDFISNFPQLNGGDDGEPQNNHWVVDEDGTELDHIHLSARYDFSLLVFLRQWNSPWTPESHFSFSVPYRQAISTLALCAHRHGVPYDITALVNSFLPRSWWQDDRRCCWCRECQVNKMKLVISSKISSRQSNWDRQKDQASPSHPESEKGGKTPTLMRCPRCQVAMACSKEHLKHLYQDGHKRYCGLPPFRAPFSEEDNIFCREIFGKEEEEETNLFENGEGIGEQEDEIDDDGSWESVDSNEEEAETGKSAKIFSFFNNKSYKFQQRERPPFADFF